MKKINFVLLVLITAVPLISLAALPPIVPACAGDTCQWSDLVNLGNSLIDYLIGIGATIAAISFSYAGYYYLTANGDTGKIEKAHKIFKKVLWGFILVLAAWLIVHTILDALLDKNYLNSLKTS